MFQKVVFIFLLGLGFIACNKASLDKEDPKSRGSYAIGYQIGMGMKNQGYEVNPQVLALAIQDVLDGKDPQLEPDEIRKAMMDLRNEARKGQQAEAEENKKAGEAFLEKNKSKEGVKVTSSGLQYEVLQEGKGAKPTAKDRVKVHYKGTLIDGTEFDSSYKRDRPIDFAVTGVIKGWTEALQMMSPGSKYKLYIPSELAYGSTPRPSIPANSVLIFDVELLEVNPKEDKPAKPNAPKKNTTKKK